jgi:hypothetical protein
MAKERESFLQEDDTDITPAKLLRRVTGQGTELDPDLKVHNITSVQESVQVHKQTNNEENKPINNATDKELDNTVNRQINNSTTQIIDNERKKRIDRARAMIAEAEETGETPVLVTIRVPAKLHDYLERYVRRVNDNSPNKRKKYLKQDAIAAAFVAFYADHPMPEKLIDVEDEL